MMTEINGLESDCLVLLLWLFGLVYMQTKMFNCVLWYPQRNCVYFSHLVKRFTLFFTPMWNYLLFVFPFFWLLGDKI